MLQALGEYAEVKRVDDFISFALLTNVFRVRRPQAEANANWLLNKHLAVGRDHAAIVRPLADHLRPGFMTSHGPGGLGVELDIE